MSAIVRLIDKEKFESFRPRFGRLQPKTVEMAYLVFVDGRTPVSIAREYGVTRQRVSLAMKQVLSVIEGIPKGWVKLEIWMPPEMADQVKDMVEEAKKNNKA